MAQIICMFVIIAFAILISQLVVGVLIVPPILHYDWTAGSKQTLMITESNFDVLNFLHLENQAHCACHTAGILKNVSPIVNNRNNNTYLELNTQFENLFTQRMIAIMMKMYITGHWTKVISGWHL